MICQTCERFYIVPSRTDKVCRDCESKWIAEQAARAVEEHCLPLPTICSWVLFQEYPRKYRSAWSVN